MKKYYILVCMLTVALSLQFCSTTKTATSTSAAKTPAKVTYLANVQGIIAASCAPCHIPPQGNKKPLNTYAAAKENIDESIRRIKLNPGERGFMPARHPKLADSVIQVFVQWKADGLLEK